MWRYLGVGVLLVCGLGLALSSAGGQVTQGYYAQPISTGGATCFLYSGYAYVPLTSAANFVGATLAWQGSNTVTVGYQGSSLTMTMGSLEGTFDGGGVRYPVPPAMIQGFAMVPVFVFHDYFYMDVNWDSSLNRVVLGGPTGYGYFNVAPTPPASALAVLQGYGAIVAPTAFYYNSVPYVPLQDWCDFLGVPVYYEPTHSDFVLVVGGNELLLFVGQSYAFYGTRYIRLPGPPIIVRRTVCVPVVLFQESPINARVVRSGDLLRVRGRMAWRQMRLARRPPAGVSVRLPARPREALGIPVRPGRLPGVVRETPRQFAGRPPYERFAPARRPGPPVQQRPQARPRPPVQQRPQARPGRPAQAPRRPEVGAARPGQAPGAVRPGFGRGATARGGVARAPQRGPRVQAPPRVQQRPQAPSFRTRQPSGGGAGAMRPRRQEPARGRGPQAGPRGGQQGPRGGDGRGRGRDPSQEKDKSASSGSEKKK